MNYYNLVLLTIGILMVLVVMVPISWVSLSTVMLLFITLIVGSLVWVSFSAVNCSDNIYTKWVWGLLMLSMAILFGLMLYMSLQTGHLKLMYLINLVGVLGGESVLVEELGLDSPSLSMWMAALMSVQYSAPSSASVCWSDIMFSSMVVVGGFSAFMVLISPIIIAMLNGHNPGFGPAPAGGDNNIVPILHPPIMQEGVAAQEVLAPVQEVVVPALEGLAVANPQEAAVVGATAAVTAAVSATVTQPVTRLTRALPTTDVPSTSRGASTSVSASSITPQMVSTQIQSMGACMGLSKAQKIQLRTTLSSLWPEATVEQWGLWGEMSGSVHVGGGERLVFSPLAGNFSSAELTKIQTTQTMIQGMFRANRDNFEGFMVAIKQLADSNNPRIDPNYVRMLSLELGRVWFSGY